jgi:hypothetical protein
MTQVNCSTIMLSLVVALGLVLVAGLVIMPEIEQQAALADKGGIPNGHASDKARGKCGGFCTPV